VAILALGAQAYLLLTHKRRSVYGFIGVGVTFLAAMQSASRGCILWVVISGLVLSAGFLWGAPWRWGQGRRLVVALRRAALIAGAGLFIAITFFPSAIGANWAFFSETLSPSSSAYELQYRSVDYPLENLKAAFEHERWPYGYGTGTASLGMQYVSRLLGEPPPNVWVESGWGVLIVEMGIVAPFLWLLWTGVLLRQAWKVVRQLRDSPYFPVALSIFWYAFVLLLPFTHMGMAPYQNYVMNAYFWLLIGILFRLPELTSKTESAPAANENVALRPSAAYAGGL